MLSPLPDFLQNPAPLPSTRGRREEEGHFFFLSSCMICLSLSMPEYQFENARTFFFLTLSFRHLCLLTFPTLIFFSFFVLFLFLFLFFPYTPQPTPSHRSSLPSTPKTSTKPWIATQNPQKESTKAQKSPATPSAPRHPPMPPQRPTTVPKPATNTFALTPTPPPPPATLRILTTTTTILKPIVEQTIQTTTTCVMRKVWRQRTRPSNNSSKSHSSISVESMTPSRSPTLARRARFSRMKMMIWRRWRQMRRRILIGSWILTCTTMCNIVDGSTPPPPPPLFHTHTFFFVYVCFLLGPSL